MRGLLGVLIVTGVVGAIVVTCTTAWGRGTENEHVVEATIKNLQSSPNKVNGRKVVFDCRFASRGSLFRKDDSSFAPDEFDNFSVWPEDIHFWNAQARKDVLPTLYLSRENIAQYNMLNSLSRYAKIKVTGRVEEVYANLPWITVEKIELIDEDKVNDAMVMQIRRALKFVEQGELQKARICFELAVEDGAPAYVTSFVSSEVAKCSLDLVAIKEEVDVSEDKVDSLLAARNFVAEKDFQEAARAYRMALVDEKNSEDLKVVSEVGKFFLRYYKYSKDSKHLESAEYFFNQINDAATDKLRIGNAKYILAYIAYLRGRETGNYKKAESRIRECLANSPTHSPAQKLLSQILSEKLTTKNEVVAVAPRKKIELSALQHFSLGRELLRNGNAHDAARHLEKALKTGGEASREARVLLASALLSIGESKKAKNLLSVAAGMSVSPHENNRRRSITQQATKASAMEIDTEIKIVEGDLDTAIQEIDNVKDAMLTLSDDIDGFANAIPIASVNGGEITGSFSDRASSARGVEKRKNVSVAEIETELPDFPQADKRVDSSLPEWAR